MDRRYFGNFLGVPRQKKVAQFVPDRESLESGIFDVSRIEYNHFFIMEDDAAAYAFSIRRLSFNPDFLLSGYLDRINRQSIKASFFSNLFAKLTRHNQSEFTHGSFFLV